MTKEGFLARCATAYDAGLLTPYRLHLMDRWLDVVMREGHSRACDYNAIAMNGRYGQGQWEIVHQFWTSYGEVSRLLRNSDNLNHLATLANDADGYALIQFAAILSHPCQICATDPNAWWTRPGCCRHPMPEENGSEE